MNSSENRQWLVDQSETGMRLDKWLATPERLGSRSRALTAIERGKIFVDDIEQTASEAGRKLQTGEKIRIWMDRPGSAQKRYSERHDAGMHLLYEDQSLMVINKPAGLLTVPLSSQPNEPSLYDQAKQYMRSHRNRQPLIVHRIDRDTSGIVVFSKSHAAQKKLKNQFEQREVDRIYLAVVHGHPLPESGVWKDMLAWDQNELKQQRVTKRHEHAKEAISRYRILEKFDGAALIEVRLATGKRHQIRMQAAMHGHPLVGERIYLSDTPPQKEIRFHRQALHAHCLKFQHPLEERQMSFEAPPPADFQSLLESLRSG